MRQCSIVHLSPPTPLKNWIQPAFISGLFFAKILALGDMLRNFPGNGVGTFVLCCMAINYYMVRAGFQRLSPLNRAISSPNSVSKCDTLSVC